MARRIDEQQPHMPRIVEAARSDMMQFAVDAPATRITSLR